MRFLKQGAAGAMAALMAVGMMACNIGEDTKWVAQYGDQTVPAGVYITGVLNSYYSAVSLLETDAKDPLKEQLDGQTVEAKVIEDAKTSLNRYIAVEQKFQEMGLTLPEETTSLLESQVESYWAYLGESFESNGISKSSYLLTMENDAKQSMIFEKMYGEGGEKEVPESELKEKFENDWAKIIIIPLSFKTDENGEVVNKEATQEAIQKYYDRAVAGEDMEELVYEAQKEGSSDPDSVTKPEPGTSYTFVSKDASQYTEELTNAIFEASVGEPVTVETETGMYLFKKYDITENPNDFVSRKSFLLSQLKGAEFQETLNQWAEEVTGVTYNDKALDRYNPGKLKL